MHYCNNKCHVHVIIEKSKKPIKNDDSANSDSGVNSDDDSDSGDDSEIDDRSISQGRVQQAAAKENKTSNKNSFEIAPQCKNVALTVCIELF